MKAIDYDGVAESYNQRYKIGAYFEENRVKSQNRIVRCGWRSDKVAPLLQSGLENQGHTNAFKSLSEFYNGSDMVLCLEGKADAARLITPYLNRFDWPYDAYEYFAQQFDFERRYLDSRVITVVERLQFQGVACHLCTDQEAIRARYLLDVLAFRSTFDGHLVSCDLGYRKSQDAFWKQAIAMLEARIPGLAPKEIAFFDDMEANTKAAERSGVKAFLFESLLQFESQLRFFEH
jgi:hypothetical protein